MTAPEATPRDVEQLVKAARAREQSDRRPRRVLAIHARPEWSVSEPVTVDGDQVQVMPCPSPLAVRAAIAERDDLEEWLVLLTEHDEHELGVEVVARLARRRIESIDAWAAVAAAFGARAVDPALRETPELASALLDGAPPSGYPPVPGDALDRDAAWTALCRYSLGLEGLEHDAPAALLSWTAHGEGRRLETLPESVADALLTWLGGPAGAAADLARAALQRGRGRDAVAIGLVCRCLSNTGRLGVDRVRGRLEGLIGLALDDDRLEALAAAAERCADSDSIQRADALLVEFDASDVAEFSDVIPAGLEARLSALGRKLRSALDNPARLADAASALERCQTHRGATDARARLEAATMAVRLARRLADVGAKPSASLQDAVRVYANDGAFIDWARAHVWRGESQSDLAGAYDALDQQLHELRDAQNARFAELLADWLQAGSEETDLLGVESILPEVVLPLANEAHVLLVVLDACSLAAWLELRPSIAALGYDELIAEQLDTRIVGLATVPSITRCSRTSLLGGALRVGAASEETRAFAELTAGIRGGGGVLYHKAELLPGGGNAVAQVVLETIADRHKHLVGVVINELDDALSGGMQADRRLDARTISSLASCLDVARQAGRLCLVTGDHGHVVEYSGEQRTVAGGGERWRPAGEPPQEGEIELAGRRVLEGGGRVVAPWTERLRYSRTRAAGYHGGASLQEMLVPVALFAPRGGTVAGWQVAAPDTPEWWDDAPAPPPADDVTPPPPVVVTAPTWVESLLTSTRYREQNERYRRVAPDAARVRLVLGLLDARGGRVTVQAIERVLGMPSTRTRGVLSGMSRVLAVDGAAALRVVDDDVVLDAGLLREGFGL